MENKTRFDKFQEWYLAYAISLAVLLVVALVVWFGIFFLYNSELATNNQWIVGIPPYILAIPGALLTKGRARKILE